MVVMIPSKHKCIDDCDLAEYKTLSFTKFDLDG